MALWTVKWISVCKKREKLKYRKNNIHSRASPMRPMLIFNAVSSSMYYPKCVICDSIKENNKLHSDSSEQNWDITRSSPINKS